MKIIFSCGVVLLVLIWETPARAQSRVRSDPNRPNIIFIISDDHRWDVLGTAGNRHVKTPVLDRLAREGLYFRQATIHVSQCAPSRATLLTGLAPHQSGYYANNFVRKDLEWAVKFPVPTMPELMQRAGYNTVLVGKWHVAPDPWLSGFSDIRTWLPEAGASYRDSRLAKGRSRSTEVVNGFTNDVFANDAIEFLKSDDAKKKPFLLWVASTIPHAPYAPNPSHIEDLYDDIGSDAHPPALPPNTKLDLALEGDSASSIGVAKYYEAVSHLDEIVGRILTTVEQERLADNTVLIFLGDNGLMAGSRGVRGKVVPWEESVRVPMLIKLPKAVAKGTSEVPASSLDVPVTILELAGLKKPLSWPGRSLLPVLNSNRGHGIDHAVSEWADTESQFRNHTHRLIRTPLYKLIRWDGADEPDELYDLVADPSETTNIADRPTMRAVRNRLTRQLMAWMVRTNDPARNWPAKSGRTPDRERAAREDAKARAELEDKSPRRINSNVLNDYTGRYEFVTRNAISIIREDDKLFFQSEFTGKVELIPKSETEFVHRRAPMRITFVRDRNGRVTHLIRRQSISANVPIVDMRARKVE